MTVKPLRLALLTNGEPDSWPALQYGAWLAGKLAKRVLVLGVAESRSMRQKLHRQVDRLASDLEQDRVDYTVEILSGDFEASISSWKWESDDLLTVGPLGRPRWRRILRGRSFRRLIADLDNPLLYVPEARLPLSKVLICSGGLKYAASIEDLAFNIAKDLGAHATLLHVIEPVSFDYRPAREAIDNLENLLEADSPRARYLKSALDLARKLDLPINLRVRHGNVVQEILDEIRSGDFDLVGLGSPYSSQSLRHLFLPNVTAEVAETSMRPVLTARYHEEQDVNHGAGTRLDQPVD